MIIFFRVHDPKVKNFFESVSKFLFDVFIVTRDNGNLEVVFAKVTRGKEVDFLNSLKEFILTTYPHYEMLEGKHITNGSTYFPILKYPEWVGPREIATRILEALENEGRIDRLSVLLEEGNPYEYPSTTS